MISFLTMFPLSSTEVWKVLFGRSKVLVGAHAATIVSQLICVFLETRLCVSNPERCTFLSYLAYIPTLPGARVKHAFGSQRRERDTLA